MRMKSLLMCKDCGHSESLRASEVNECPKCKSPRIELIPYSKSRGPKKSSILWLMKLVEVILGILGFFLFIYGLSLVLGASGLPGDSTREGVTFSGIGLAILVLVIGVATKGNCFYCCSGSC